MLTIKIIIKCRILINDSSLCNHLIYTQWLLLVLVETCCCGLAISRCQSEINVINFVNLPPKHSCDKVVAQLILGRG